VTPDELAEQARRLVQRSTDAQGLPFAIEDPSVLEALARQVVEDHEAALVESMAANPDSKRDRDGPP
jgi:hypothetical protein